MMANSPTGTGGRHQEEEDFSHQNGGDDQSRQSADLDLNQAIPKEEDLAENPQEEGSPSPSRKRQSSEDPEQEEGHQAMDEDNPNPADRVSSPADNSFPALPSRMSRSPDQKVSPSASPSPSRRRSLSPVSPVRNKSASPDSPRRKQDDTFTDDGRSPAGNAERKAVSPSALSPEKRAGSTPPRGRSRSPRRISPHRRHSPEGDRRHDPSVSPRDRRRRDLSSSRSPVGRSGRSGRSRSRSPPSRSHRYSPRGDRSRYSGRDRNSPRRRSPPSSYRSRRRHSPSRRARSPPSTGLGKPGNNLFIAGLSFSTTERDLEKKFSRYGRVTEARIIRDKRSGDSRGFGFLSLEHDEDADAAIRGLDQTEWNGRRVLVEKARTSSRY